jgi:phosphoribulokinase
VLGFDEPQPLTDLTTADFDQVFAALDLAAPKVYGEWFERQERPIRQALRVAKQSPRQRADAAKEAAKRPDADQLRASLTEGDES